jgi:hypothetical protein
MLALKFVYVVGNGRAVKIGKSTTPEARIASLNPGSSAPLVTFTSAPQTAMAAPSTGAHSLLSAFRLRGEMVRCRAGSQEAAIAAVETAVGRSAGAAVTAAERSGRQGASLSILARISSYCDPVRAVFGARGHSAAGSKAERRFDDFGRTAAAAWDWRRGVCEYEDCALSGSSAPRRRAGRARSCIALDWGRMRPWRA